MPFRSIEGLDLKYALISFDKDGRERTDDPAGGVFSKTLSGRLIDEQPTDVFLFSHGWKGDFDASVSQYDRWMGAMWKLESDRSRMGASFRPMFIGLHWPSQPWGKEDLPAGVNFAESVAIPVMDALFEKAVEHFGGTMQVRDALSTIFDAQKADPGSISLNDETERAYRQLAAAIGFSAGGTGSAPPDVEGAALDPQEAIRADRIASSAAAFGGGSFFKGLLGGLGQLSFWMMKSRARTVGEGGMHDFIGALQNAGNARIHLMGHSFGCVVVSSILGGMGGTMKLPRPVESLALVQGALSLWSYGDKVPDSTDPGYFHGVLDGSVAGPIITTQSIHDLAVGVYYPAAVGLVGQAQFGSTFPKYGAVGTFGLQGTGAALPIKMLASSSDYNFKPGGVYNLEASSFIKKMNGASGAHSDIDGPEVAHALWQAARVALQEAHA